MIAIIIFGAMVIAVYAGFNFLRASDPVDHFVNTLLKKLAATYTEHKFYMIGPATTDLFSKETHSFSIIHLPVKPGFFYNYRLNRKVEQVLKQIEADVLFSIDRICKVSIPQSVLITSLTEKKYSNESFRKLNSVFVLSEEEKDVLTSHYKIAEQKINILFGGPTSISDMLSEELKISTKNKYTQGKEYFIYRGVIGPQQNIIRLLKGFSFFKKRQKSSMKLLLLGKQDWAPSEFEKIISTYKYREEVVIINEANEAEEAKLIAAAYAYIQPYASHSLLFVLDALQFGVPAIVENSSPLKRNFTGAALYFDAADNVVIAEQMMLVYRDEALRNRLIEKGKEISIIYSWQQSLDTVAKILLHP